MHPSMWGTVTQDPAIHRRCLGFCSGMSGCMKLLWVQDVGFIGLGLARRSQ